MIGYTILVTAMLWDCRNAIHGLHLSLTHRHHKQQTPGDPLQASYYSCI